MLTNTSTDNKAILSKHVKNWVNIVNASSMQSSSISASPCTSTAPPSSSSTLATSASHVESYSTPDVPMHSPMEDHGTDSPAEPVSVDAEMLSHVLQVQQGGHTTVQTSITVTNNAPKKIKMDPYDSLSSLLSLSSKMPFPVSTHAGTPSHGHFNIGNLPDNLHKDSKWHKGVIPTLILWARNQDDAFNISKQDISNTLQEIIPVVYPVLKNTVSSIHTNSAMVSVVTVVQLTAFFLNPLDPSPQDTMQLLLEYFAFLYEDLDSNDPDKAFCSVFMQQLLLTSHLNAMKGYVQVPALDTSSLAKHGMAGALGLCGAVVSFNKSLSQLQHGLTLIKSGNIELKSMVSGKDGIAKLTTRDMQTPKKLNMASGKDSRTTCAFSDQNWGTPMRKLMCAAKRRTMAQLQHIVAMACASYLMGDDDPEALSNAGSEDEYTLICSMHHFNPIHIN
ncbi:hypothetical protein J3A83DRAFT_4192417 [Scleroderma citrinum]